MNATARPPTPTARAGNVPALVLAAGLGTRLYPLSTIVAKPAVPVAGETLVGRVLRSLRQVGLTQVVINLHHKPETITRVIGDGSAFGLSVRYSWEREILGSGGGPARALSLLEAPRFVIINGDTLTDVDLDAVVAQHVASGAAVTMAVIPNPDPSHYGGVVVAPDGQVTAFSRRGPDNTGWHFIGVQVVEASVYAAVDPDRPSESVGGLYRAMLTSRPGAVQAYRCHASFHDVGTATDYLRTCLDFAARANTPGILIAPGCQVAAGARVHRSVVWPDVEVGPGADLEECIVTSGVRVPAGLVLRRVTIVPHHGQDIGPRDTICGDLLLTPLESFRP